MPCQRNRIQAMLGAGLAMSLAAAGFSQNTDESAPIARTEDTVRAIKYRFSDEDHAILEQIQRGCFNFFWNEVGSPAGLVKDRRKGAVASIAAVGFQLSTLPIGVERGWVKRDAAEQRALAVLRSLAAHPEIRKFGMFSHFPDHDTAGVNKAKFNPEASTVDTALFLCGAITAGEYFGGEVRELSNRFENEAEWRTFVGKENLITMGWMPKKPNEFDGPGKFITNTWWVASDEERLVYFMAVGSPNQAHAVPAEMYYRLKRIVLRQDDMPPFVASWPGSLFTYFFAHCWIDHRAWSADDPAKFKQTGPRVDWLENSRRAVLAHRRRCIEAAGRFRTFSEHRWGLSPCNSASDYIVPELKPSIHKEDIWFDGTVAPYAAGTSIMFTPEESMAALREFVGLKDGQGAPLLWRDPATGGYGLCDSFNLDRRQVSDDDLGIDAGPLILGIENARSGLIWKLFMQSQTAQRAVSRLRLAE